MGVSIAAASLLSTSGAKASTDTQTSHTNHAATHTKSASTQHNTHSTHHQKTSTHHQKTASNAGHTHEHVHVSRTAHNTHTRVAAQYRHSGLQCVPYAREISHVELTGNAFLWWAKAAGRYARGTAPEQGAVLNFRSISRMPLGHVAVVTAVLDSRTILVTQANWIRGTITNDVTVQDVSANNDWSQVEVELGDSSKWGASYPTYGFIYNRPDAGTVIASNGRSTEVAMAPAAAPMSAEAPNRNLQ
jgi:surface antigen